MVICKLKIVDTKLNKYYFRFNCLNFHQKQLHDIKINKVDKTQTQIYQRKNNMVTCAFNLSSQCCQKVETKTLTISYNISTQIFDGIEGS